jgi:hypothetical protein
MTRPRPRTLLGVAVGVALAATAAWLAVQLLHGNPPSPATQPPAPAPTTTAPTATTSAPAFTKEGAIAGLRIIVRKRLEAFNTLDASILETLYTPDCRLADGRSCLKTDQKTVDDFKRKNQHLDGYPNVVKEIRVLSWEPQTGTAVMRLVYEFLPARIVDSHGQVVERVAGTKRVVDQANLIWDGNRWRQAWGGTIEESR